jgi:acetylornithine deacetylase/succinyl-diaminopimelate desuccinylase-like protein
MATQDTSLTGLLAELVAFKTVSGDLPAAFACTEYLENFLMQRGMNVQRHISNEMPSLVATTKPVKNPKVLLQAHIDVVPCPGSLFKLVDSDGKLIGRGVFDMKFAGAVFLKLVDELQADLANYNFGIMFTFDEEIGGRDGVGALLEAGYRSEVCILPDAGDNWCIEATQKGAWLVRLSTTGVAVHGSRPWEGDNAIHRLNAALYEINKLFAEQNAKTDSLSINMISGGNAMNQVADWAEAVLDIRFLSNDGHERLTKQINEIAGRHGLTINTAVHIKPTKTDMSNPFVKSFLQIAEDIHGSKLDEVCSLGTSDSRYFAELDIPVILLRPNGGAPHSDAEWLDKASFEKYYELIKKFVQKEAKR